MADRDPFELEMSPGMQPPSGFGDRVLVGLALAVLIGAGVIVAGNVLPDPNEVADASEAPSSQTPRPGRTADLPRIAGVVEPDLEFSPPTEQPGAFSGWIRALSDIVIWSSLDEHATEIGVLKEGEVAYADQGEAAMEPPGWLALQGPVGWIKSLEGGIERVRHYDYPRYLSSGWVNRLTAGPDGFMAILSQPSGLDSYEPSRPAISTDGGASWRLGESTFFSSTGVNAVAWGPAGWLAAGFVSNENAGRIWIWGSADGLAWTRLGMLDGLEDEFVTQLIASDHGYLMETYSQGGSGSPYGTLWSSPDGLAWRESTDPLLVNAINHERRIAAVHDGFYLWDAGAEPAGALPRFAAFSEDGVSWSEVGNGPDGANLQLTEIDDRLVAIDLDRKTMATRVWTGTLADRQVSWIRETASEAAFAGAVARQIVSDGRQLFAFGWDMATEEPLVWTGNGLDWVRAPLPESFGGIPMTAAGGPQGVVVVGYRHTLRGDNPIFWRFDTGRWLPEPDPILEAVPDPAAEGCPDLPDEFIEYMTVDSAAVVSCHGPAPITLRAYSVSCDDCGGGMDGNPQPSWLLNPGNDQLWLAPGDRNSGWSTAAVLGPSLMPPDPAWIETWVEVTGHFDDPAAATCHREPFVEELLYWSGTQAIVDQCRMTFVVTKVTIVEGP